MLIPADQLVKVAVVTGISTVTGEHGVYVVHVLLDGVPETFHIELEGRKTSFKIRERSFYQYQIRCPTLKGIVALMRKWHRGERRRLPVDLATVDFV